MISRKESELKKVKYLTKSRFKTASDCPRKLYYHEHSEYGSNLKENDFMKALAEGGFQVGALSKIYYEGGIDLEDLHGEEAIALTEELLKQEKVTIFEAAIQIEHFLIRVDILQKNGNEINLIEVKAKSHDFKENSFFKKQPTKTKASLELKSDWEPYLVDIAFQTWVTELCFPQAIIHPFLYLIDKNKIATEDGLHQNFLLIKDSNGRSHVQVKSGLLKKDVGAPLLTLASVRNEVDFLIQKKEFPGDAAPRLPEYARALANQLKADAWGTIHASLTCKDCEFRISKSVEESGLKSGFKQCWTELGLIDEKTASEPIIFDLWDNRRTKTHLNEGIVFLKELQREDLEAPDAEVSDQLGISRVDRQLLQIEKTKNQDPTPYFDHDYLAHFFKDLKYPLHFIDFETTRTAIPFHQALRPYEQIAYQFSHHTLSKDGSIAHQTQYLHLNPGHFPNFEFARALYQALKNDDGTIFSYAPHENSVLNDILRQFDTLLPGSDPEVKAFLKDITSSGKKNSSDYAEGKRVMKDLCVVVKKSFYALSLGGSNSIKAVTPTLLNLSKKLQEKYSKPIYGRGAEIPSLNFEPTAWVQFAEDGSVLNPYLTLPPVEIDTGTTLSQIEQIKEGGGASTAWARMQFTEMSETEREALSKGLLRYCELDTLSMVWLFEYLLNSFY